jgi:DNA-binding beta-propeller fold protein YncE
MTVRSELDRRPPKAGFLAERGARGYGQTMLAFLGCAARRRRGAGSLFAAALLVVVVPLHGETLLVVRKSADAVDFVDPGSGFTLSSVPVGLAPHEISRSPDGRLAAVSNYGTRDRPGATISILDLEHPRELRRIELGEFRRPHGIVWYAEDRIAVTTEEPAALLVVDPRAERIVMQVATGQAGSHMVAVIADPLRAFVTNLGAGSTTAIDLVGGRRIGDIATGAGSEAIAISRDGREVWVAAGQAGTLTVLDAQTLDVRATLPLPGRPIRIVMTPDGTALVTCAASSEIVAFDVRGRRELSRRPLEAPLRTDAGRSGAGDAGSVVPVGVALGTDAASVFVAATQADAILELALPELTVRRAIAVTGQPDGMALTPVMPQAQCHACEAPPDPFAPDQPRAGTQ